LAAALLAPHACPPTFSSWTCKGAGQINKLHYTVAGGTNYPYDKKPKAKKTKDKKPKDKKPKDKKPQDNDKQPVHTYFISSDEDEPVAGSSAGGASGSSSGV
jgi:hypothetical protein